jgi:exonuclease VII small subunit
MTTTPNGSSGTTPPENVPSGDDQKKDLVAYETHQKLLGEKKRTAEKLSQAEKELEDLRARERERENAELERNKNFEQLLKNRETELKEAQEKLSKVDSERVFARKIDAFLKTLGGDLPEHYWGLIPLEEIALDPTTKSVDEMTVAKAVEAYRKLYPETIKTPGQKPNMPSSAPAGSPDSKMDYESWKSLKYNDPAKWAAVREGRVQIPK